MTKRHDSASGLPRPVAGTVEPDSAEARAKCVGVHEVRECPLAVDLDDREEFAIVRLEIRVALDVDHLELEPEVSTDFVDDLERPRAEAAVSSAIDGDSTYGYRPRVVVASATRWTASP